MSSNITFIDNNKQSGDWCVILLDGKVVHEGHSYPKGYWFVEFFRDYQGITEDVKYIQLYDDEIENWRERVYGE